MWGRLPTRQSSHLSRVMQAVFCFFFFLGMQGVNWSVEVGDLNHNAPDKHPGQCHIYKNIFWEWVPRHKIMTLKIKMKKRKQQWRWNAWVKLPAESAGAIRQSRWLPWCEWQSRCCLPAGCCWMCRNAPCVRSPVIRLCTAQSHSCRQKAQQSRVSVNIPVPIFCLTDGVCHTPIV